MYQTRNPSEVVAAELDRLLLADPGLDNRTLQLLPDSELFQRSNINLATLAQTIQGEKGIRMMNRRWHWRLHYDCFIGMELTSWMLQNFRDIDTREEAVEFGNDLMKDGLFQHVVKRHNFRDGNYFYQIASEYRVPRPESRGWFPALRSDKSIPATPMSEMNLKESPVGSRSRSTSNNDDESNDSAAPTPTKANRTKLAIALSKSMRLDVDHRKRSDRPEIIDLHYDRLHNPDGCYHIMIEWLNVTSKLIEDSIVTWATSAEKFGLRLVGVPIAEASSISDREPFRAPYKLKLKVHPPDGQSSNYFSTTSFSPQGFVDRLYYQKAILKKFNFVLDLEAATDFPPDVDVSYSWGKPDYRYPQFIHRSGVLLAQITDDGNFLLLANRLYNTRGAATKDTGKFERYNRNSPNPSPLVRATPDVLGGGHAQIDMGAAYLTPERIKDELETFCGDENKLKTLYSEIPVKSTTSAPNADQNLEASIPSLQLPASLVSRQITASPKLDNSLSTSSRKASPRSIASDKP